LGSLPSLWSSLFHQFHDVWMHGDRRNPVRRLVGAFQKQIELREGLAAPQATVERCFVYDRRVVDAVPRGALRHEKNASFASEPLDAADGS
jgi:hypothetical protein